MTKNGLNCIFNPKSIAVIGASNKSEHPGFSIMKNLFDNGYKGEVFPVNNKRKIIRGIKTYSSILDIPQPVDLAIIATPADTVPAILRECGIRNTGGIIIISAGFLESGTKGAEKHKEIINIISEYNLTVIGPNCMGIIRPSINLYASFAKQKVLKGKIAFISQSGALCSAILDWSFREQVGFSHFISIGDMADVSFHDLIDYLGKDPETGSILMYIESLSNARRFLSASRAFARTKPIVVLKSGRSSEGAKAALSHTGSIAGNDTVYNAAFKRAGILRVDTIGELFDCAQTLSSQKPPPGKRLAIITNAGGPGVIATDKLIQLGGELASLSQDTLGNLNKILPANWSRSNPIDIVGDAGPQRYKDALEICLKDKNIDAILILLTVQAMTNPTEVANKIVSIENIRAKTILASFMGENELNRGRDILEKGNIPVYRIPENAVTSFMNMYKYQKNLELLYQTPATIPHAFTPNTISNNQLIKNLLREKKYALSNMESQELFRNYQIPVVENLLATTKDEAITISERIGYPLAMKIASENILHKTDIGGVRLNIKSYEEAGNAFDEIITNARKAYPKANIQGVTLQKMENKKYELIIGCKKDPIFGPVILFGMGGVAVEVFKDLNVGLPPLNMILAQRLIEETKIYTLLKGYRGMKGVDIASIQFLLYKFAYLIMDFPQIKEIDINPFVVDENGGAVLDAKVILDEKIGIEDIKPYSHLVISPYPKEYISKFIMKNGKSATLRPVRPEDEPMEAEMFTKFSQETQRFRFFSLIKDITHEMLIRFTQIDYDREIAIIAEVKEEGVKKMAGVVRLIADPYNNDAEFALVVADPWQNLGLGNMFMDFILEIAESRGIKKIFAFVLDDNAAMLHMLKKRFFEISLKNGLIHAQKNL